MDGAGAALPFEQFYYDIPIISRLYATGAVAVTLACVRSNAQRMEFDFA